MRRSGIVGTLAAMAVTLTACPFAPPPGYTPPKVVSVETPPQPVAPGGRVRFVFEVTDDETVLWLGPTLFITPTGTTLNAVRVCDIERVELNGQTHVRVTVDCPVFDFASNGTWKLQIKINDGGSTFDYPGTELKVPFEVAGGSDDREGPRLLSYSTDPAVIDQGTSFTLTMRLSDETFPVSFPNGLPFLFGKPFSPDSRFECRWVNFTPVSATEGDLAMSCTPTYFQQHQPVEVGTYNASPAIRDALNQERNASMTIQVLPR